MMAGYPLPWSCFGFKDENTEKKYFQDAVEFIKAI